MKRQAFIYTWSAEDEETDTHQRFHIRMYGMGENGENVCIHVKDFMPYFYIEFEGVDEFEVRQAEKGVQKNILSVLGKHEAKECKKGGCSFCWKGKMELVEGLKKLYFYHKHNSFGMMKVSFPNNIQRKRAFFRLQEKQVQVGYRLGKSTMLIHENEANPILQFCTNRRIDSTGWVKWKKDVGSDSQVIKQTLCDKEVHRSYVDIGRLSSEEEKNPVAPYVLSFDIEVYSSVPSRMPDAEVDTDVVFQISMVFSRDMKETKEYLLTLGKPIQSMVGKQVFIQTFATERDLLIGFSKLIQKENPNVVIGYNIFGFDINYMICRAKKYGIMDLFDQIGMRVSDRRGLPCHAPEKEISWSSSAYSHQNFLFLDAEGRLFIDLLPVVRRDYKFENYRLKTIAEAFIGDTKDPITPKDIFSSYAQSLTTAKNRYHLLSRVGKYCVQDSKLVLRLFEKLQTWIGLCEMAKTCRVPILTLYTQGQQIKVFSQLYFECTHNKIVVQSPHSLGSKKDEIKGADHYSGAMVFPPDPGVYDWVVPFDFSSLYPSTIIAYNIDYSTLVLDKDIPDEKCHVIEWWDHIGCEHDTTVHATKPKSKICEKFRFRFLKEPIGVLPRLLRHLLDARKNTKNKMKELDKKIDQMTDDNEKASAELLYQVYDKRQLAFKVSANSMYGAMGVQKGYLPFFPGAMCTTAMGRESIQKAARFVRENFDGKIVYGDTDSIYCHFSLHVEPEIYANELWKHAKRIEKVLLTIFPPPMKLVFEEKIYKKFLILTKKRYMALTCDHTGQAEDKLTIRGVLLARRDNARWVRQAYEKIVRSIMSSISFPDLVQVLNDELLGLFRREIPLKMFIVSKTLGAEYAVRPLPEDEKKRQKRLDDLGIDETKKGWEEEYRSKAKPAHVQLSEKMKRRGNVVEAGSRIEFAMIQHPDKKPRQFERIEDPSYLKEHGDVVCIDPMYYAQNLINPADQVFSVCFKKEKVLETMVKYHEHFKSVMEELMWFHHPYEFCNDDGTLHLPPFAKKFKKPKKKSTAATTPPLPKAPKIPVQRLIDDMFGTSTQPKAATTTTEPKKRRNVSTKSLVQDLLS